MIQKDIRNYFFIITTISFLNVGAQDVEAIFQRGNSLHMDGKYEEALMYVDSSLNMDSSLYQRFHFRAELKAKLGLYESAIEDVDRCISRCTCSTRNYHVSNYYLDRASLRLLMGDTLEALNDANRSVNLKSGNWKALNYRSGLYEYYLNYEAVAISV